MDSLRSKLDQSLINPLGLSLVRVRAHMEKIHLFAEIDRPPNLNFKTFIT